MNLRAVIFDVGGTLVCYHSLSKLRETCMDNSEKIGVDRDILSRMCDIHDSERKEGFQTLVETNIFNCLSQAFREKRGSVISYQDCMNLVFKIHFLHNRKGSRIYPGARDVLDLAKRLNLKIGLISNTSFPGKSHEEDIGRFGISDYFDIKIWSSDFGFRKPNPKIFLKVLDEFNVSPQEAIYIGDKFDRDVVGPNRVGMLAIWIKRKGDLGEFCGWQVKSTTEVIPILQGLKT